MYFIVCTLLLLVPISEQTAHIEAIEANIETAILSIQNEDLWAIEDPPPLFTRYKDTYYFHPSSSGNLRVATAECLRAGSKLYANSPQTNPREIFELFNISLGQTWILARLDGLSMTVVNKKGSILFLASSEYQVDWQEKPTKLTQCVSLVPPTDQANVFHYTKTACGTPLPYFCEKPVPERNTDKAIRERKAIISDIVNSLRETKEKLQLAKTFIEEDNTDHPATLNEVATFVSQIQQELTGTEINTGVISQKANLIQDSIDTAIIKITRDFAVNTRETAEEIKLTTKTNEDKINGIAIRYNNQNAIIAKKVEVDQLIAVHKDIISVKTELKRCNSEIAIIKAKNTQQDSEIHQANSVIQDYFETDEQIEQSEEEHSEQLNVPEDSNQNNQTEQEKEDNNVFIDDDEQSEENGSGITYSNTTVPPPQTTPVTDEPNKGLVNKRIHSPKRIGQSQLVTKIISLGDRIANVEQYISKNATQKLIKKLKKLEKRISDCCDTHFKWFSEIISTLAVILSTVSLTVQIYIKIRTNRRNSENNTRVYFQVRKD